MEMELEWLGKPIRVDLICTNGKDLLSQQMWKMFRYLYYEKMKMSFDLDF